MSPTLDIAPATFDSLGAFVAVDPARHLREEIELGDFWLTDGWPPAAWRAAWLPVTGELYLQRLGPVSPGGQVTVAGAFADLAAVEGALAGWEDECGTRGSIAWLLERLGLDEAWLPGAGDR